MPFRLARRAGIAVAAAVTAIASAVSSATVAQATYANPYKPLTAPGAATAGNWGWAIPNPAPRATGARGTGALGDATGDGLADIWGTQWDGRWSAGNRANGLTSFFSAVPPYQYHGKTHIDVMKSHGDVGYNLHNATAMLPAADLNGDGWADFLVRQNRNMYVYYNRGGGYLTKGPQVGSNWDGMDTVIYGGHLNGDATNYVVARDRRNHNLYGYTIGSGGQLSSIGQIGRGWGAMRFILAPGQMTGDKKGDLVAIDNHGVMTCYTGLGRGRISSAGRCGSGWNGFDHALIPGDMDGDGLWDLVGVSKLTHPTKYYSPQEGNTGSPVDRGTLYFYKNLGNGHWGPKHMIGYDFYQYNVLG